MVITCRKLLKAVYAVNYFNGLWLYINKWV